MASMANAHGGVQQLAAWARARCIAAGQGAAVHWSAQRGSIKHGQGDKHMLLVDRLLANGYPNERVPRGPRLVRPN